MTGKVDRITDIETIRELVSDFDELLGLDGNFWKCLETETTTFESPDKVQELARDLLVELFGMEVRGL
jgi:hypothetical protein